MNRMNCIRASLFTPATQPQTANALHLLFRRVAHHRDGNFAVARFGISFVMTKRKGLP
jgi:hypothetical protein